jgi:hypothetical protein
MSMVALPLKQLILCIGPFYRWIFIKCGRRDFCTVLETCRICSCTNDGKCGGQ